MIWDVRIVFLVRGRIGNRHIRVILSASITELNSVTNLLFKLGLLLLLVGVPFVEHIVETFATITHEPKSFCHLLGIVLGHLIEGATEFVEILELSSFHA